MMMMKLNEEIKYYINLNRDIKYNKKKDPLNKILMEEMGVMEDECDEIMDKLIQETGLSVKAMALLMIQIKIEMNK